MDTTFSVFPKEAPHSKKKLVSFFLLYIHDFLYRKTTLEMSVVLNEKRRLPILPTVNRKYFGRKRA